jgi:hypothetical protein
MKRAKKPIIIRVHSPGQLEDWLLAIAAIVLFIIYVSL